MASAASGCSTNTRVRESSAPLISKLGFSVVAPIRVMVPSSDGGRRLSCWALLSRWISSTKRMVCAPPDSSRARASPTISRIRGTPSVTALNGTNTRCGGAGHQVGQRGLAAPGRTPEDHRAGNPALDRLAERLARGQQVLLTDELVQRPWPHPRGQRLARLAGGREQRLRRAADALRGIGVRGQTRQATRASTAHLPQRHDPIRQVRLTSVAMTCPASATLYSYLSSSPRWSAHPLRQQRSVTKKATAPPKNAAAVSQPRLA